MISKYLLQRSTLHLILCLMVLVTASPASALELSFSASTVTGTGSAPLGVVAADFNDDGKNDLAVLSSNSVIHMIGNGDGTFQSASTIYSGSNLIGMASGDFDKNGQPDLAVVSQSNQLGILRNTGSSFSTENMSLDGFGILSIATGDFDNDGWIDLALLTNNGTTVVQFFNYNGIFLSSPDYTTNVSQASRIQSANLDNSGTADVMLIPTSGQSISFLQGQPIRGTFLSGPPVSLVASPRAALLTDFNGDGTNDLAVLYQNGTAAVLPGSGVGSYGTGIPLTTGTSPQDLASGEFSGDSKMDVIFVNQLDSSTLNTNTLAPVWSPGYPTVGPVEFNSATLYVKAPENGTVFLLCLPGGSAAPSALQVSQGLNANELPVAAMMKGRLDLSPNSQQPVGCSSMTPATAFDLYVVLEQLGYLQSSPAKFSVVTPPTAPPMGIFSAIGLTGFTASWSPSSGATSYFVDVSTNFGFSSFVGLYNNYSAGTATSLAVSGLSQGTTYHVRVRAAVSGATSLSSYPASVTTLVVPTVPSLPQAADQTNNSFTMSWKSAANATGYRIDVASDQNFEEKVPGFDDLDVKAEVKVNITGLTAVTTYYFRVRAYNATATSASSEFGTITTLPPVPAVPTLTASTNITSSGFTANWGSVPYASGYRIDVANNSGFSPLLSTYSDTNAGNGTSFAITGLTHDSTYYFRLRASNISGTSSSSATGSVTLPPTAPFALPPQGVAMSGFIASWKAVSGASGYKLDVSTDRTFVSYLPNFNNRDVGNVLSFPISGTTPGMTYYYRVRTYTAGGISVNSQVIVVLVPERAPLSLAAPRAYLTGSGTTASVTADFNGDGIADVAAANQQSDTISVLIGMGDGRFNTAASYASGTQPVQIAAADLNNDGRTDLITLGGGTFSIFLGNGDGTFMTATPTSAVVNTADFVIGDFTSDGKPDLVFPSPSGNSIYVLPGIGNGTFGLQISTPAGSLPNRLVAADFNGDGKLDLAVTNSVNLYSIFMGNGNGTFLTEVSHTTSLRPWHIATGDLNADGKIDLVMTTSDTSSGASTITILQGIGDGTFTEQTALPCGTWPRALALEDLNNDGKLDVLTAANSGDTLYLYYGNGNANGSATFLTAVQYKAPKFTSSITVTDYNADGSRDIGLTSNNSSDGFFTVFQQTNGVFNGAPAPYFSSIGAPLSLATGDFNMDGISDVAGSIKDGNMTVALFGDGTGGLQVKTEIPLNHNPNGILASDLNSDGASDIITTGYNNPYISVVLSNGSSTFQPPVLYLADSNQGRAVSGDFNGDNIPDIAVANNFLNKVSVLFGSGNGIFLPKIDVDTGVSPYDVIADDFNDDGHLDLAASNAISITEGSVSVMIGNGNGGFAAPVTYPVGPGPYYVASGDFNRDGKRDLAVSNSNGSTVSILLGVGDGTFGTGIEYPAGIAPNQIIRTDLNGDGVEDLVTANEYGGYITALLGKGDGTFMPAQHFWSGSTSTLATGIFSSSGKIDIAVADRTRGGVMLLKNSTAPAFQYGYPQVHAVTSTTAEVLVKSGIAGSAYAVCLPSGSSAPTPAQVKAGQNADGSAVAGNFKASVILTAGVAGKIPLSSLTPGSEYVIYVIFDDSQSTLPPVPDKLALSQPTTIVHQVLTVTVTGTGTVYSQSTITGTPLDIACSSGSCSASYPEGSMVTLTASPSWYSTVNWGGVDSSLSNDATVTMNNARAVTTGFMAAHNVQVSNPAGFLGSIKLGFISAVDGSTVKAKIMHFPDLLTFSKANTTVTLLGGLAGLSDAAPGGYSTIQGPFSITGGRLNIRGGIKVQSGPI